MRAVLGRETVKHARFKRKHRVYGKQQFTICSYTPCVEYWKDDRARLSESRLLAFATLAREHFESSAIIQAACPEPHVLAQDMCR